MTKLLPILLLCSPARAAMMELTFTGVSPIIVYLEAPLPARFAEAVNTSPSAIIHHADYYTIDGGFYTGVDSFDYLLPIAPTNLPQSQYSFAVWDGDPAKWRINVNFVVYPHWIVLGQVIYGFDALAALSASDHATVFGIADVPVDANSDPYTITHYFDVVPRTLQSPEPATLAVLSPVLLMRKRK